ncbi:hypothetical protein CBM2599_A10179 [Cupriavidus taiwanensis]|nr:hypothetical protein CBM2599_A10179 [Cupriavidus taiwanensis]
MPCPPFAFPCFRLLCLGGGRCRPPGAIGDDTGATATRIRGNADVRGCSRHERRIHPLPAVSRTRYTPRPFTTPHVDNPAPICGQARGLGVGCLGLAWGRLGHKSEGVRPTPHPLGGVFHFGQHSMRPLLVYVNP